MMVPYNTLVNCGSATFAAVTSRCRLLKAPVSCINRSAWSGPEIEIKVTSGSPSLSKLIFKGRVLKFELALPLELGLVDGDGAVATAHTMPACSAICGIDNKPGNA